MGTRLSSFMRLVSIFVLALQPGIASAQFIWLESFTQNGAVGATMTGIAPHPSGSCWVGGSYQVGNYETSIMRYYNNAGTRLYETIGSFGGKSIDTKAVGVDGAQNGYHFFMAYSNGLPIYLNPIISGISKISPSGVTKTWTFTTGYLGGIVRDDNQILDAVVTPDGKIYLLLGSQNAIQPPPGNRSLIAMELSESGNGFQVERYEVLDQPFDLITDFVFYGGKIVLDGEGWPVFAAGGHGSIGGGSIRPAIYINDWNPASRRGWQTPSFPNLNTAYPRVTLGILGRYTGGGGGATFDDPRYGVCLAVRGSTIAIAYSQVVDGNNYEESVSGSVWCDNRQTPNPDWHDATFSNQRNNFCFAAAVGANGNIYVGGRRSETQPANLFNRNVGSTGRAFVKEFTPSGSVVRDITMPIGVITFLHENKNGDLLFAGSFVETNRPERMVSGVIGANQTGYGWLSFGYNGGSTKAATTTAATIANGDDGDLFGAGFLGDNFAMGFRTTIGPTVFNDYFDFRGWLSGNLYSQAPGVKANDKYALTGVVQVVTHPQYGTLTLMNDGSFAYRRRNLRVSQDSFTYRIVKQGVTSNSATVTLNLVAQPDQ